MAMVLFTVWDVHSHSCDPSLTDLTMAGFPGIPPNTRFESGTLIQGVRLTYKLVISSKLTMHLSPDSSYQPAASRRPRHRSRN
jgi:hypothetical protein